MPFPSTARPALLKALSRVPQGGISHEAVKRFVDVLGAVPKTVSMTGLDVDWSLSDTFVKAITVDSTFTFSNAANGDSIRLWVNGAHTITWPAGILWGPGGVPTQTTNVVYDFTKFGGAIFGKGTTY